MENKKNMDQIRCFLIHQKMLNDHKNNQITHLTNVFTDIKRTNDKEEKEEKIKALNWLILDYKHYNKQYGINEITEVITIDKNTTDIVVV